jgi:hypothetical protein
MAHYLLVLAKCLLEARCLLLADVRRKPVRPFVQGIAYAERLTLQALSCGPLQGGGSLLLLERGEFRSVHERDYMPAP